MKIRIVGPVIRPKGVPAHGLEVTDVSRPDVHPESVLLDCGPISIECEYDEALAAPDTVSKVIEAERDGCDAVVISCFGDPALHAAREKVSIPVVGPGEASMHLAASLGHRFSVVTVVDNLIPLFEDNARLYGLEHSLASVRSIGVTVLDLEETAREWAVQKLVEESILAIDEDGAHVIVLGCTGMTGLADAVHDALTSRGHEVPVIDPGLASLKVAEMLVDAGLTHSKRTYPVPPVKEIVGYRMNT